VADREKAVEDRKKAEMQLENGTKAVADRK
jgi:hypothetical protein